MNSDLLICPLYPPPRLAGQAALLITRLLQAVGMRASYQQGKGAWIKLRDLGFKGCSLTGHGIKVPNWEYPIGFHRQTAGSTS